MHFFHVDSSQQYKPEATVPQTLTRIPKEGTLIFFHNLYMNTKSTACLQKVNVLLAAADVSNATVSVQDAVCTLQL